MPVVVVVGHPSSGKTRRATQLATHLHHALFSNSALPTSPAKHVESPALTAGDETKEPLSPAAPSHSTATSPPLANPLPSAPHPAPAPTHEASSNSSPPAFVSFKAAKSKAAPASSNAPIQEILLVNHEALLLPRVSMYASGQGEKAGRSAFRAAVERSLTSSRVVIVDYLNHIKGYRYELWCRAREMGTTYAVLYVDTPPERCREWNAQRPEAERYDEAVMTDLLQRMEAPNGSKRWDEPLFTVKEDDPLPVEEITQWLLHGKSQVPGLATLSPGLEDSSYLQRLDGCLSSVCSELVRLQSSGLVQVGDDLPLPSSSVKLRLVRRVHLGELKRIQSHFVRLAKLRPMQGEEAMATAFVAHLQVALEH